MPSLNNEAMYELMININATETQINRMNQNWTNLVNDGLDELPHEVKLMMVKHHTRKIRYYETQLNMYRNISNGNIKQIGMLRKCLLHYGRGVMDDMLECENEYPQQYYIEVCDGFKDKMNCMDTWINAVK